MQIKTVDVEAERKQRTRVLTRPCLSCASQREPAPRQRAGLTTQMPQVHKTHPVHFRRAATTPPPGLPPTATPRPTATQPTDVALCSVSDDRDAVDLSRTSSRQNASKRNVLKAFFLFLLLSLLFYFYFAERTNYVWHKQFFFKSANLPLICNSPVLVLVETVFSTLIICLWSDLEPDWVCQSRAKHDLLCENLTHN